MNIQRLKDHKYSKCHVEIDGNKTTFISYNTAVIFMTIKNGIRTMECTGTYSQTTRKQIGYFLKQFAPDLNYHDMKNIVGQGAVVM